MGIFDKIMSGDKGRQMQASYDQSLQQSRDADLANSQDPHQQAKREWQNISNIGQRRNEVEQERVKLAQNLQKQRAGIEAGEPARKNMLMEREGDIARSSLAKQLQNTNRAASSRGLLYSGINQQAQQQAALDNAQMLGEKQQGIAQQSQGLLRGLEDASIQDEMERADMSQQQQLADLGGMEMDWKRQYAEQQANQQGMNSLGAGIGQLAGAYFGSTPKATTTTAGASNQPWLDNLAANRKKAP